MKSPDSPISILPFWPALACLAIALPTLVAYNVPPSATFFNQAAAFVGWGGFLLVLTAALTPGRTPRSRGLLALLGAFALVLLAALAAPFWAGLPWPLVWSHAGTIVAAALVAVVAAALAEAGLGAPAFRALCFGLLIAGLMSAAIGIVQVYAPQWTEGDWIARTAILGRAVGNVRQPNHLSSLLLWAIVAAVWLGETRSLRRPLALGMAVVVLFVVVLTGSRTGALGTLTLAAWGLVDRRLSRPMRVALLLSPIAYAAMWGGAIEGAQWSHRVFGGASRFSTSGDVSSSRFGIWSNTLSLVQTHPWFGVGFGEFNFAWTMTPFPNRPVAFFDHTHNIVLQFVVELGLPLAATVLGLFGWALAQAARRAVAAGRLAGATNVGGDADDVDAIGTRDGSAGTADMPAGDRRAVGPFARDIATDDFGASGALVRDRGAAVTFGSDAAGPRVTVADDTVAVDASASDSQAKHGPPMERAALVMVLMVMVHSLLEYPLWYSYFLLPTTFAFGLCLGDPTKARSGRRPSLPAASLTSASLPARQRTRPLVLASMALVLGGVLAVYDYMRVVVIFAPPTGAAPLAQRITEGRRSVLFGHHADYAFATTAEPASSAMAAFKRAPHYLLDARLMMAWAEALNEAGEVDRARYVAQRLREFHNEQAEAFFAPCELAAKPDSVRPFQCQAPSRAYSYNDFR